MIARFGHDLAAWLLPVNAWTLALLLGALVLDRALQHRALASLRIALYAPVALRVLVPFSWSIPVAGLPRLAIVLPADTLSRTSASAASPQAWEYVVLAVVYGVVALLMAGISMGRRWRLARALRGSKTLSLPGQAYPVTTHPELGPMVAGLWNPRIVLPEGLANGGDPAALACVLDHEAAHIRRGDPWLSAGLDLLLALAWPVAPLWIVAARVRNLVELACDEAALEDADAAGRRRYGHLLLDLAERGPHLHSGQAALYFGSKLRARVEAIAHRSHWATSVQWALVAGAVVAFAACSSAGPDTLAKPSDGTRTASAGSAKTDQYGYQFENDSFGPGSAAQKQAAGTVAPATPAAPDPGRLAPELIQNVVRNNFGRFRTCYETAAGRNKTLAGTVTVSYVIAPDGSTHDAKSLRSTLPDANTVQCVVDGFSKLSYPPPEGGYVTVVYPIEFSP